MADFPLTPSFFKKLGIYQDLMDYEKNEDKKIYWELEKECLRWTAKGHHHLAASLDADSLYKRLPNTLQNEERRQLLPKVMGNLCQHGYAYAIDKHLERDTGYSGGAGVAYNEVVNVQSVPVDSPSYIVFSQDGILAGRVVYDIEKKHKNWTYRLFIDIAWLTILVIFISNIAYPLVRELYKLGILIGTKLQLFIR